MVLVSWSTVLPLFFGLLPALVCPIPKEANISSKDRSFSENLVSILGFDLTLDLPFDCFPIPNEANKSSKDLSFVLLFLGASVGATPNEANISSKDVSVVILFLGALVGGGLFLIIEDKTS